MIGFANEGPQWRWCFLAKQAASSVSAFFTCHGNCKVGKESFLLVYVGLWLGNLLALSWISWNWGTPCTTCYQASQIQAGPSCRGKMCPHTFPNDESSTRNEKSTMASILHDLNIVPMAIPIIADFCLSMLLFVSTSSHIFVLKRAKFQAWQWRSCNCVASEGPPPFWLERWSLVFIWGG